MDQLKATIDADQGAIDNAHDAALLATITAPFDGLVGFRQLDAGNIIHPADANPLTVLTQIKPAMAIFTLPQKNLGDVREAMRAGAMQVSAYDQDGAKQLATGELLLIDNQIDQGTSTIRLKARFPNTDARLWPGEVRARARPGRREAECRDDPGSRAPARAEQPLSHGSSRATTPPSSARLRPRCPAPTP